MRKYLYILLLIVLIYPISIFAQEVDIESKKAIVYNLNDDKILYEKNSEE